VTAVVLRRLIAERISGLKKAGVELPIVSEVAVSAKIIKENFVEPRRLAIAGIPPELAKILGIPFFAYGEAYGETAGQWYRVSYPKSISGAVPVCVAEGRTGAITTRPIDKIVTSTVPRPSKVVAAVVSKVTKIGAAKIAAFEIPRIERGDLKDRIGKAYVDECERRLGDWGWANWIRDAICRMTYGLGWVTGAWIEWLWDILVQPQINKVRDAANSAISRQVDNINAAFSTQMDRVDDIIEQLRVNMNAALSAQTDRIDDKLGDLVFNINFANSRQMDRVTDSLNLRLNDLYMMWGIPSNMAVTPVHTRNCTDSGFDFQSFGDTTIHYIAIGGS